MPKDKRRHDCLDLMREMGDLWEETLDLSGEGEIFKEPAFWNFFTKLWISPKGIKKMDAGKYLTHTTPPTALKYINKAIELGLLIEFDNQKDTRSKLIALSDSMKNKLDQYLDRSLESVLKTADKVKERDCDD